MRSILGAAALAGALAKAGDFGLSLSCCFHRDVIGFEVMDAVWRNNCACSGTSAALRRLRTDLHKLRAGQLHDVDHRRGNVGDDRIFPLAYMRRQQDLRDGKPFPFALDTCQKTPFLSIAQNLTPGKRRRAGRECASQIRGHAMFLRWDTGRGIRGVTFLHDEHSRAVEVRCIQRIAVARPRVERGRQSTEDRCGPLRRMFEPCAIRAVTGKRLPLACASEFVLERAAAREHVFERHTERFLRKQPGDCDVRQDVGTEAVHDAKGSVDAARRLEAYCILFQLYRESTDQRAVLGQHIEVAVGKRGVCGAAIPMFDEYILNHRRRPEYIQTGQQQLWIGGETLQDRIRERPPMVVIARRARVFVGFEEWNEVCLLYTSDAADE